MPHIWLRMKRSACIICSCMNSFMAHLRIYRTGAIQTLWPCSLQLWSSRPLWPQSAGQGGCTHTAFCLFIPAVLWNGSTPAKTWPTPGVNDYKVSTNGLRGRADLHHSPLFFVSVAERGWIRREVFLCRHANGPVFCCSGPSQLAHRAPCFAERKRSSSSVCHSNCNTALLLCLSPLLPLFFFAPTFGGINRRSSYFFPFSSWKILSLDWILSVNSFFVGKKESGVVKATRNLVWGNFVSPVFTWKSSINRSRNNPTVTSLEVCFTAQRCISQLHTETCQTQWGFTHSILL